MSFTNILVAYDGSENSKNALEKAKGLAQKTDTIQVHILTVWKVPTEIYNYEASAAINYNAIAESQKEYAASNLKEAEESMTGLEGRYQSILLEGFPADKILEYTEENNIDLIVIGSRGLSGLKKLFLGSVSHNVAQSATCSVLIVK